MYSSQIDSMVSALVEAGVVTDKEKAAEVLDGYWSDKIADVWHNTDVIESLGERYPQMTEGDAREILLCCHRNMDSEYGINWTTIETETDWYFDKSYEDMYEVENE